MRLPRSLLALGLAGCGADERTIARPVLVSDGGYALVEVRVFGEDTGEVVITVEGAEEGEGYGVFRMYGDPPFHSGWFDLSPWVDACERAPSSRGCTDVDGQRAGTFIGVSRQRGAAVPTITERQSCDEHPEFGVCIFYYAIVSAQRGPERRAWVTVTTSGDDVEPPLVTKIR